MNTSYKINNNLYIANHTIDKGVSATIVQTEKDCNHILVVDVSGSMSGELVKVREHLKSKLKSSVKENDTVTIVWFSGRTQFGTLMEGEKIGTLADLKTVNEKIDRWLRPVGMTAFKEPLDEVANIVGRLSKANANMAMNLAFMTDGGDNCWSEADILAASAKAGAVVSSVVFVEYGYYANRPLLTKMAEKAGGSVVHSKDFQSYAANIEAALARRPMGSKKLEVKLPNADFIGGIAFTVDNGSINTFAIDAGKISVPEDTGTIWFLTPAKVGLEVLADGEASYAEFCTRTAANGGHVLNNELVAAVYAATSLFVTRMKPEIVRPLLKASGDVAMIEQFTNCFGKQAYSEFMDSTKKAAFGQGRWAKGWDSSRVPADDAFTVLDMLKLLASDDDNRVLLNHEAFQYNKIGRSRVDSNTILTSDEQDQIELLTEKLAGLRDLAEVKKITAQIDAIANKPGALAFVEDTAKAAAGYPVANLTYNEERPNVSILVRKEGKVDLSDRKDKPAAVPSEMDTFIFRNYAVVKDGLVNVEVLPTILSAATIDKLTSLVKEGKLEAGVFTAKGKLVAGKFQPDEVLINMSKLPVINALMVKSNSAKELFTAEYDLTKAKAAQKVFNSYIKEKKPEGKKSEGFASLYGDDGAAWLKAAGFTEYSGFAPKSVQAEATDFYMSKEMAVSLSGLSALPTLKDVKTKMAAGKALTASVGIMAPFVTKTDNLISGKTDEEALVILEKEATAQKNKVRDLIFQKAQSLFAVVVGNSWFKEFPSLDDNSLDLTFGGQSFSCKVDMKEAKVTI